MFAQPNPGTARRQRWLRGASLGLHALILAWLLHSPEPKLLTPVSVASGQNGKSVTRLYWSSKSPDDSTHSSPDSATERFRHQRLAHEKLTFMGIFDRAESKGSQARTLCATGDPSARL